MSPNGSVSKPRTFRKLWKSTGAAFQGSHRVSPLCTWGLPTIANPFWGLFQCNGRRPCSIERGGSRVGAYRAFFEFRISRFEWPFTLSELIGGSVDQASSCRGMVYLSGSKRLLAVLLFMKVWDDLMPSNALLFAGLDIGTPVPERGKPESPKKGTLQSRHLGSRMLCCPDV